MSDADSLDDHHIESCRFANQNAFPCPPRDTAEADKALELEGLGSLLMDSLFARSLENNQRAQSERSNTIYQREVARSGRCYDRLAELIDPADERVHLGSIAVVCALGYANWRAPEDQWARDRDGLNTYYERFMRRPAFAETAPVF